MNRATLFGKLPAHGDFVTRGMAPAERDLLDLWLAQSLADARARTGEAFEDVYDTAPPWRFAWRDEGDRARAGEGNWVAGAMAPSVDSVGRRYPILVAIGGLSGEQVEHAADLVEGFLYDALGEGWDADRLHAAATASAPEPLVAWEGGEGWWTLGAEGFNEAWLVGARPAGLMSAVLTPAVQTGGAVQTEGAGPAEGIVPVGSGEDA